MSCSAPLRNLKFFSVLVLVLLLSSFASAQGGAATGDLHISVRDPKGSFVANATVTVRDAAKGLERAATPDGQGGYTVRLLPPGTYSVTVEAAGFAKAQASNMVITVGGVVDLPVALAVATGKEVVEVTSQADLIETSRTSTTDTIGQQRIDNLPINGRNYINFTLTDSQVVRDNAPNTGAAPTSGLNMSGQRARSNLVNVDGADATDNSTNGVRSTVSQEDVQEFQIITNNYSPEYGRAAGGVVNIITRSGSNEFHGDVYGFLRNRNFQAVNPFSTVPNPAYTRVQAGTAFGGPIKKDKTYYFFSYEITRRHETGFASIGEDCLKSGGATCFGLTDNVDLSSAFGLPPGTIQQGVYGTSGPNSQQAFFQSLPSAEAAIGAVSPALATAYGQEAGVYATFVGGSSGIALNGSYPAIFAALQGTAIPIPSNGSSALTQFPTSCNFAQPNVLCNSLPSSFLTLNSQIGNFPVFEGTSLYSFRIDHNLTTNQRLMFRINVSPSTITGIEVNGENQVFGQNAYSRTSQQTYRDIAGVFQDTWAIGSNRVNEFRFQYARRGLSYYYNTAIPGGADVAENIPGYAYFGREPYSYVQRVEQRYQFTDNFSWTIGRHNTKFGGDFDYLPLNATFTVNYGGLYDFGSTPSADFFPNICAANGLPSTLCPAFPDFTAIQSYGLGFPNELVQGYGSPTDSFSNKPLGVFWQDSWRATQKVTLNYGLRYDIEFPPQLTPLNAIAKAAYNELGLQKGIQTDTHNLQPRFGLAWDPRGDGKTVMRASYGIFFDHPLLALYFLGDASDASSSGQLVFGPGAPCSTSGGGPSSLNATNTFQGILTTPGCLPTVPGYIAGQQRFNPAPFSPSQASNPQNPGLFVNQNFLNPSTFFPMPFLPFGYPQAKNFVYAYSQQVNLSIERDLGHGYALSLAYNFNGGRHLNRPINANTARGDLLMKNYLVASTDPTSNSATGPLGVGTGVAPCGINPSGQPWVSAALTNFFRPSAVNPSLALAYLSNPASAPCVTTLLPAVLGEYGLTDTCNLTTLAGCVPFSDMDANYSNGNSNYNGFSANLRKRFNNHYEFLASYTWSHAIDDSTDLQAPLAPQDSYYPSLERSNSLFDQRHRFVFSGVYQSGKLGGKSFTSRLFSNWTLAPIIEFSSGRPFNIITGNPDNFQFSPDTGRPNTYANAGCTALGYPVYNSKYSPTGIFQEPCLADFDGTLLSLDGNFPRNGGVQPWTVFNDMRVAKRIYFGERFNMELIADTFNIANRFNVAAVNQIISNAGQATAAYDPRQFQFALKFYW
jgi:hypothetical protein